MDAIERALLIDRLQQSRTKLLDAVANLTPEQWKFRPAPDQWSIADCVEHVVMVEKRILKLIAKVLSSPAPDEKPVVPADDDLERNAVERINRFTAPEALHPKQNWPDTSQLLSEFEQARARSLQFASETQADLRNHFYDHLFFGPLDCYQWMRLIPVHCDRHCSQVEEIKAGQNFQIAII